MNWQNLPPLSALRAFAAFATTGGVQEAGQALNVSHAAISQQLRALETHLGLTLLDRSGRAMTLTSDGQILAETLRNSFADIARVVDSLTGAEDARPLHISATNSFAANWLMPRLARFRSQHPKIELVIDPNPALVDPAPGKVDLAIRYGAGYWPGLISEELIPAPVIGVAATSLVGKTPPKNFSDLSKYTWFQELGTHEATNWLETHGLSPEGGLVTVPANLALDAARMGEGIIVIGRIMVEADLASGRMVQLFEDERHHAYHLVTHNPVQRPALRAFTAWLRREAKNAVS